MRMSPLQHVLEVVGMTALILFIVFVSNNPSTSATTTLVAQPLSGITSSGALSSACDSLYNLPVGTVTSSAGATYLNPQVCAAYQYLISIYNPGPASQVGLTNAKVTGITSLNEKFAIALAGLLKAANAKGYNITIASAYRTRAGEAKANPVAASRGFVSMHTLGLAADLVFPEVAGNSSSFCGLSKGTVSGVASYNFIIQNEKSYGLGSYNVLHNPVKGECNHVEWSSTPPGGLGPGTGANVSAANAVGNNSIAATPSSASVPQTENDTAWSQGQTCPAGQECYTCTGNSCSTVPAGTPSGLSTGCAANQINYNGICYQIQTSTTQSCTLGTVNLGGACVPMSMMQSLLNPQTTSSSPPPPAPVTPTPTPQTVSPSSAPSLQTTQTAPTTTQTPISSNLLQTTPITATAPTISTNPITIPTITIPTLTTPTSTQAELTALENPPQLAIPPSATATPININGNINAVSQLAPTNVPTNVAPSVEPLGQTNSAPASAPTPTQNGASLGQVTTEQPSTNGDTTQIGSTFTSGNLGGGATSQKPGILATFGQRTASAALAILQTLQGELIKALQFLKPFNSGSSTTS